MALQKPPCGLRSRRLQVQILLRDDFAFPYWKPSTLYQAGDVVHYNDVDYWCGTEHVSSSALEYDKNYWSETVLDVLEEASRRESGGGTSLSVVKVRSPAVTVGRGGPAVSREELLAMTEGQVAWAD